MIAGRDPEGHDLLEVVTLNASELWIRNPQLELGRGLNLNNSWIRSPQPDSGCGSETHELKQLVAQKSTT